MTKEKKKQDKEAEQRQEREEKEKRFEAFVEEQKKRSLRVKYKYSDGFQIQKTLTVRKDMEIGDFLELARLSFLKEYPQLLEIKGRIGLFFVVGNAITQRTLSFRPTSRF